MRRVSVLLVCTLSTAAVLAQTPESQTPTFRARVDLVDVDVSVLDKHRQPVLGLTVDDFTVLEDGRERPLLAFSAVNLPSRQLPSARWMADVAPDVLTNTFPPEGRLIAILIDRSIAHEDQVAARQFAEAAVDQLRPGDMAAVAFSLSGVPQNFTADRERLKTAIRQPFAGIPQAGAQMNTECYCGRCTLESVGRIAEALGDVRQRRKLLFVLSSRISIQSSGNCGGQLALVRGPALRALEAANITVHVFDPRGVEPPAGFGATASRPATIGDADLRRRGDLQVLPAHTGGRLLQDNPVRPGDLAAELFRESDSYYVLGFQPRTSDPSPRFHRISVKVNRKDVTLQVRRGYYTQDRLTRDLTKLPETFSPALRNALNGLWPDNGVSLAMNLVPLAKPALDGGLVAVTLDVTQQFDERHAIIPAPAAPSPTQFTALVGAFDRNGRALASERQTLVVTPRRMADRQFQYQTVLALDLEPGRYEVRAAVEDGSLSRAGSVYGYVDVPDFRREAVSLSGVVLSAGIGLPSTTLPESLRPLLPILPTARRQFTAGETVNGFVRLYRGLSRNPTPGYLTTEIKDDQDQVVYRRETRVTLETMGTGRATDIDLDVPLDRLKPGPYLLAVETRHGNETARRDVRFDVKEVTPTR